MGNNNEDPSGKAVAKAGLHRWAKGQSGNPAGYKAGSKHKATLLAESMIGDEAGKLIRKIIELGLAGDVTALRIVADRLLPPHKTRPVHFKLPTLRTTSDAMVALTTIVEGVTSGQLLPEEAESLTATISTFIKAHEICTFEDRLIALEKASGAPAVEGRGYDA
jgi:hypothetical protein